MALKYTSLHLFSPFSIRIFTSWFITSQEYYKYQDTWQFRDGCVIFRLSWRKWTVDSIPLPQLPKRFTEFWKLCWNLWFFKGLRSSRKCVESLVSSWLCNLKMLFWLGPKKVILYFLKVSKAAESQIFKGKLLLLLTADAKKMVPEKDNV